MTEERGVPDIYPVPAEWKGRALGEAACAAMYEMSLAAPDAFWLEQAQRLDWMAAPVTAGDWSFDEGDFRIEWFTDGTLNVAANCIDRHLADRADDVAIIWEPDDPAEEPRRITFRECIARSAALPMS